MAQSEVAYWALVRSALEATLPKVLGDKITAALRFYVDLDEAARNLPGFSNVLTTIVGRTAAVRVCKEVLQEICRTIPEADEILALDDLEEACRRSKGLFLRQPAS